MTPRAAMAVALSVVLVAGCSGTSEKETPQDQELVTSAQISRVGADSPGGVTLRLWRALQIGDIPSAVIFYHGTVRRVIGVENIAGTLAQLRASASVLRAEIVSAMRTPLGVEVTMRATSSGSSVGIHSFLLRRDGSDWRVAYDTLLGDALPSYVERETQHRLAPGVNRPLPEAQLAGIRIGTTYRTLFVGSNTPARSNDATGATPRRGQ